MRRQDGLLIQLMGCCLLSGLSRSRHNEEANPGEMPTDGFNTVTIVPLMANLISRYLIVVTVTIPSVAPLRLLFT